MAERDIASELHRVLDEAYLIVVDRGEAEGRNKSRDFWETFPHGLSDMTFMVRDKADRVLGAEQLGRMDIIRDNALDIINYAAFIVMWIDRETRSETMPRPQRRIQLDE